MLCSFLQSVTIYFLPDPLRECLLFPILAAIPVATPAPIISEAIKGSLCSVSSFSWLFVISFKSAKFKRKVTDHKVCITVNTFSLFSSQFRSTFGGVAMERNTYELKIILYRKLMLSACYASNSLIQFNHKGFVISRNDLATYVSSCTD